MQPWCSTSDRRPLAYAMTTGPAADSRAAHCGADVVKAKFNIPRVVTRGPAPRIWPSRVGFRALNLDCQHMKHSFVCCARLIRCRQVPSDRSLSLLRPSQSLDAGVSRRESEQWKLRNGRSAKGSMCAAPGYSHVGTRVSRDQARLYPRVPNPSHDQGPADIPVAPQRTGS